MVSDQQVLKRCEPEAERERQGKTEAVEIIWFLRRVVVYVEKVTRT